MGKQELFIVQERVFLEVYWAERLVLPLGLQVLPLGGTQQRLVQAAQAKGWVEAVEELLLQTDINYGTKKGNVAFELLKNSDYYIHNKIAENIESQNMFLYSQVIFQYYYNFVF